MRYIFILEYLILLILHTETYYRLNLIFGIVMRCGLGWLGLSEFFGVPHPVDIFSLSAIQTRDKINVQ